MVRRNTEVGMRRFDYTATCDCGQYETLSTTLNESKKGAREHLKNHNDKTPNWKIYIDQYDHKDGELSGKYWTIIKNH